MLINVFTMLSFDIDCQDNYGKCINTATLSKHFKNNLKPF